MSAAGRVRAEALIVNSGQGFSRISGVRRRAADVGGGAGASKVTCLLRAIYFVGSKEAAQ